LAAEKGHKEVVEILLQNGADPNIKNYENKTASEIAKNQEIASLISKNIYIEIFYILSEFDNYF